MHSRPRLKARKGFSLVQKRFFGALALALALTGLTATASDAGNRLSFTLRGLPPKVTMLTVLPGSVVPLEALDPETGTRVAIQWTAAEGQLIQNGRDTAWKAPTTPGVVKLSGEAMVGDRRLKETFTAFVTVPLASAKSGYINGYRVGKYPAMGPSVSRSARSSALLPAGFIRLDAQSAKMPISRSFTLGQFAVKDGPRGEKFMMLSPSLLEKLETILDALNAEGYEADSLRIMSGYRTPAYNAGIGNKTRLSRHTYGDAADVLADDWDRDGRITKKDAQILYRIADKLDRTTHLKGGLSLYPPNSAHSWFVHVDTRGKLARW